MRRFSIFWWGLLGLLSVSGVSSAFADRVKLKNGNVLEGEVRAQTPEQVVMRIGGIGDLTVSRHEIAAVELVEGDQSAPQVVQSSGPVRVPKKEVLPVPAAAETPHQRPTVRYNATTVEEAYRAIPHRRTVFDERAAKMAHEERDYLEQCFELVDAAIVERVRMLQWLKSAGKDGAKAAHYDAILAQLNALPVPERLRGVHELVIAGIQEQRQALAEWERDTLPMDLHQHPLVGSSSAKLRQAYQVLMQLYPEESTQNKDAIFDYLCALDFI